MKAKLLTISLMVGLFMGCHDFLDVKPVGKLIPTEVEEFENILNNTYTVDWYYMDNNKGTLLASLGDNLQISENSANYNYTATHPNINRYAAYTFKLPYGNPEKPDYFWEWGTYRAVGLLNNVIDGVNDVKNEKTAKLAEELSAQARAARAWSYLTMAMIYGPVYDPAGANDTKTIPYRTAASPTEANPALSTTAEVFGLAKADIDFALKSVPDNVNHPARMNRCAVQTLMAYYYMFARDFGKMLEYADMAWTSALAQQGSVDNLIYNYNDFYYEPDPEASPSPGTDVEVSLDLKGQDDYLGQTYHREMLFYRVAPSGGMGSSGYPSVEFISLFDKNTDLRYRLFMLKDLGYATTVGDTKYDDGIVLQYYRDVKIKMTQGFSYPELLLMRAEAYARNSRKTEALSDLNTLRKYRYDNTQGSTDLPNGAALTEDQLLEEILKERRREYHSTYVRGNILGACLCILGAAPLFLSAAREDEWVSIVMLCCMFALSGLGVATLILVGVPWAAMEKLLQEGSYSPKEKSRSKARSRLKEQLSGLYWLLATAAFLAVGLADHNWAFARVYWPVAGVLFAGLMVVLDLVLDKREAPDPEEDGEP